MTKKAKLTPAERAAAERELAMLNALSPEAMASAVAVAFGKEVCGEIDHQRFYEVLHELNAKGDSLRTSEKMLLSQAHALNVMFANLARRGQRAETMSQFEGFMRMALRSQNQARMTLETLATIKNPPVVFAKQANIANNQQVNNGEAVPVARGETGNRPNEQWRIGHDKGQSLDGGTLQGAIGSRASLEAVATVNRSKDRQR
jgi:hypothetical protein